MRQARSTVYAVVRKNVVYAVAAAMRPPFSLSLRPLFFFLDISSSLMHAGWLAADCQIPSNGQAPAATLCGALAALDLCTVGRVRLAAHMTYDHRLMLSLSFASSSWPRSST